MNERTHRMASHLWSVPSDALEDLSRSAAQRLANGGLAAQASIDVASWLCAAAHVIKSRKGQS